MVPLLGQIRLPQFHWLAERNTQPDKRNRVGKGGKASGQDSEYECGRKTEQTSSG